MSVVLAACAAPTDVADPIVYDPCAPVIVAPVEALSPTQSAAVGEAIALWRAVGVTALTLDDSAGTQRVPLWFKDAPEPFHGVYEPRTGEVGINLKMKDRMLAITVAHELGHAMGLPHVEKAERSSVMNPSNGTVAPTPHDERQLRDRWSCLSTPSTTP